VQPLAFCLCGTQRWPNPYGFPYDVFMADVVTTGEARDALHQIAKRFDNGDGEPVYFGSHRRAQGVIVPVDVWEKLLEQAEDELDLASARQRLAHDDGRRLTRGDLEAAFRGAAEAAARKPS
jgi:antitoxin StbD